MKEFVKKGRAVRRQYITALLNGEYSASYHDHPQSTPQPQNLVRSNVILWRIASVGAGAGADYCNMT